MRVEHWFDTLSRPRTRRSTLKTAALAGAALILPGIRTPQAWATDSEPCFQPCLKAANQQLIETRAACDGVAAAAAVWHAPLGITPSGLLALLGNGVAYRACRSGAPLVWHRRRRSSARAPIAVVRGSTPAVSRLPSPRHHAIPTRRSPAGISAATTLLRAVSARARTTSTPAAGLPTTANPTRNGIGGRAAHERSLGRCVPTSAAGRACPIGSRVSRSLRDLRFKSPCCYLKKERQS